ncbi:MAG: hypothetical protein Q8L78_04785 [Coxiellaceae bacterium]|nr:hypothetical protein [Coxiellaceae bacterium]
MVSLKGMQWNDYANHFKCLVLIGLSVLIKCIPHLPNVSPELVFSLYLTTTQSKKIVAVAYVFLMWILSDIAYGVVYHTSAFGSWSLGTYSAVFAIMLFFSFISVRLDKYLFMVSASAVSLFFWAWTNFNVWIFSGMYGHTLHGLLMCYFLAIPFLTYALTAAVFWSALLMLGHILRNRYARMSVVGAAKVI